MLDTTMQGASATPPTGVGKIVAYEVDQGLLVTVKRHRAAGGGA